MRPEAVQLAERLEQLAGSLSAQKHRLDRTGDRNGSTLFRELGAEVLDRLAGVTDALQRSALVARRDQAQAERLGDLVAEAAAVEAFGAAVLGRKAFGVGSLTRWADLLDRTLLQCGEMATDQATAGTSPADITGAAEDYLADARRDERVSVRLSVVMIAVTVAGCGIAAAGLLRVASGVGFGLLGAHLAVAAVVLVAGIPLWYQAERHRRAAADARRMARQLTQLAPYLAPLPEGPRTVMRAVLAQRLFARPLGDDDPLREPLWPSAQDLFRPAGSQPVDVAEDGGE